MNLAEDGCPASLLKLLKYLNHHYILVNSVNNTQEYHRLKIQELMEMISKIYKANDYSLYTNEIFNKAKAIEGKILAEKEDIKKKRKWQNLKPNLKKMQNDSNK